MWKPDSPYVSLSLWIIEWPSSICQPLITMACRIHGSQIPAWITDFIHNCIHASASWEAPISLPLPGFHSYCVLCSIVGNTVYKGNRTQNQWLQVIIYNNTMSKHDTWHRLMLADDDKAISSSHDRNYVVFVNVFKGDERVLRCLLYHSVINHAGIEKCISMRTC